MNNNSACILDSNTLKNFEMPQLISKVSVTHQFEKYLPSSDYQNEFKTVHLMQEGALSGWKICPENSSSLVILLGGSIEICLLQSTQLNTELFGRYCVEGEPLVLSLNVLIWAINQALCLLIVFFVTGATSSEVIFCYGMLVRKLCCSQEMDFLLQQGQFSL